MLQKIIVLSVRITITSWEILIYTSRVEISMVRLICPIYEQPFTAAISMGA